MLLLLLKYSFNFQQRLFACGETFNEKKNNNKNINQQS